MTLKKCFQTEASDIAGGQFLCQYRCIPVERASWRNHNISKKIQFWEKRRYLSWINGYILRLNVGQISTEQLYCLSLTSNLVLSPLCPVSLERMSTQCSRFSHFSSVHLQPDSEKGTRAQVKIAYWTFVKLQDFRTISAVVCNLAYGSCYLDAAVYIIHFAHLVLGSNLLYSTNSEDFFDQGLRIQLRTLS